MARAKKKKGSSAHGKNDDPLHPGISAFDAGDYVETRRLLSPLSENSDLSEAQRQQARDTVSATWFERGAVLVGLACATLFVIAVVFTSFKQP